MRLSQVFVTLVSRTDTRAPHSVDGTEGGYLRDITHRAAAGGLNSHFCELNLDTPGLA